METKVCCVTGHRSIPAERIDYVKQALRREVLAAIEDGYTRFISGFAEGTDLMFAAIVAEEMEHRPELFLEAAIPYAARFGSHGVHPALQLPKPEETHRSSSRLYPPRCGSHCRRWGRHTAWSEADWRICFD